MKKHINKMITALLLTSVGVSVIAYDEDKGFVRNAVETPFVAADDVVEGTDRVVTGETKEERRERKQREAKEKRRERKESEGSEKKATKKNYNKKKSADKKESKKEKKEHPMVRGAKDVISTPFKAAHKTVTGKTKKTDSDLSYIERRREKSRQKHENRKTEKNNMNKD